MAAFLQEAIAYRALHHLNHPNYLVTVLPTVRWFFFRAKISAKLEVTSILDINVSILFFLNTAAL